MIFLRMTSSLGVVDLQFVLEYRFKPSSTVDALLTAPNACSKTNEDRLKDVPFWRFFNLIANLSDDPQRVNW